MALPPSDVPHTAAPPVDAQPAGPSVAAPVPPAAPEDFDLHAASFDLPNPPGTRPRVSYIVCSLPRSGSTLLADGMSASGCMGVPGEYFNAVHLERLAARWGCSTLAEYLEALQRFRTDRSGAFGLKVHWAQLLQVHAGVQQERGQALDSGPDRLLAHTEYGAFLRDTFPGARFIHITRLNRVRQAVSWYVGSRTGQWHQTSTPAPDASGPSLGYNEQAIFSYLLTLDAGEAAWADFFRANRITPVTVVYESLSRDYESEMQRVMQALGVEPRALPGPRLQRQANERTEALVRQAMRALQDAAAVL